MTTSPRQALADSPIDPSWIDEGQPRARGSTLLTSAEGTICSGEWECTAGRFRWMYFVDEMVHIVEGEAFIEVDGAMKAVGPGDALFFPLGQTVRWHVPKYVRKIFFVRQPTKTVNTLRRFKVLGAFVGGLVSGEVLQPLVLALT